MVSRFRYYLSCLENRKNVYRDCISTSQNKTISCSKTYFHLPVVSRGQQSFYSHLNGFINFRSNGLQVVTLISTLFRSFVLSIRSNVKLAMCASFFSGLKSINDNYVLFACLFLSVSGDNLIVTIMF